MEFLKQNITVLTASVALIVLIVSKIVSAFWGIVSLRSGIFFSRKISHLVKARDIVVTAKQKGFYQEMIDRRVFGFISGTAKTLPAIRLIQEAYLQGLLKDGEISKCSEYFRLNDDHTVLSIETNRCHAVKNVVGLIISLLLLTFALFFIFALAEELKGYPFSMPETVTYLTMVALAMGVFAIAFLIMSHSADYLIVVRRVARRFESYRQQFNAKNTRGEGKHDQ